MGGRWRGVGGGGEGGGGEGPLKARIRRPRPLDGGPCLLTPRWSRQRPAERGAASPSQEQARRRFEARRRQRCSRPGGGEDGVAADPSAGASGPESVERAAGRRGSGASHQDRRRPGRPRATQPQATWRKLCSAGARKIWVRTVTFTALDKENVGSGLPGGHLRRCRASPFRDGYGGVADSEQRVSAVGCRPESSCRSAVSGCV